MGTHIRRLLFKFYILFLHSVLDSLGNEYGEPCILDLEATWLESEPRTPLICILSIGSDPSPQISILAKLKEISELEEMNSTWC